MPSGASPALTRPIHTAPLHIHGSTRAPLPGTPTRCHLAPIASTYTVLSVLVGCAMQLGTVRGVAVGGPCRAGVSVVSYPCTLLALAALTLASPCQPRVRRPRAPRTSHQKNPTPPPPLLIYSRAPGLAPAPRPSDPPSAERAEGTRSPVRRPGRVRLNEPASPAQPRP